MKRLKLSLTALAVLIAVGGAVATKASSTKNVAKEDGYYWYDESGNLLSLDGPTAEPPISCPSGSNVCARGFTEEQSTPPTSGGVVRTKN